jgi:hypothetical protein
VFGAPQHCDLPLRLREQGMQRIRVAGYDAGMADSSIVARYSVRESLDRVTILDIPHKVG